MPNNDLIIGMPRTGIAQSPHIGVADCRNLDISYLQGIVQLNKKLSKQSASIVTGLPKWQINDPVTTNQVVGLDDDGNVYFNILTGSTTWYKITGSPSTDAHGNGLAIFNDWAVIARDAWLDFWGPLSPAGFTTIYGVMTVSLANPMVIAVDVAHGLSSADDDRVSLWTTDGGYIRSSASVDFANTGTSYFISNANANGDGKAFTLSATDGGVELSTAGGSKSGTFYFKVFKDGSKAQGTGTSTTTPIVSDVLFHPMLVSKLDGKLYGGSAYQAFSLEETVGTTFNPRTNTFTFTQEALPIDLPTDYRIKCIAEKENNVAFGTWKGSGLTTIQKSADLFLWDRTDNNPYLSGILDDYGIHALLSYGNSLVCLAGISGAVFQTDGVNFQKIGQLPLKNTTSNPIMYYPGAISKYKDKIYFGVSGDTGLVGLGVYSLEITSKGAILNLEHLTSEGTDGTAETVTIGSLCPVASDQILVGFLSNTTNGIDITSSGSYAYTTNYSAYFDTPLYPVGTPKSKRIFTELDILFAKKLATTQGVRISYRTNLTDSFTVLGTWTHDIAGTTILGAVFSHFEKAGLPPCEMIQLRIALGSTNTTTPQLKQLVLR